MKTLRLIAAAILMAALAGCAADSKPQAKLPGRLYFLGKESLTVLEQGKQRTVDLPAGFKGVALSPGGRMIAGVQGVGTDASLVLVPVTEKGGPVKAFAGDPTKLAWSPDGSRLAAAFTDGTKSTIRLFDTAGQAQGPSMTVDGKPVAQLEWAPDGSRLAVGVGPSLVSDRDLWMLDPAKSEATLLARKAVSPLWSPDSRSVYYALWDADGPSQLVMQAEGGQPRVIVSKGSLAAAIPDMKSIFEKNGLSLYWTGWSPGRDRLGISFKAAGPDPRFVMLLVNADGTAPVAAILPVHPTHGENKNMRPPMPCGASQLSWAQSSQRVIAQIHGPGCRGKVSIRDAATLEPRSEVNISPDSLARFSPDGNWVAASQTGKTEFVALSPEGERFELTIPGELMRWDP